MAYEEVAISSNCKEPSVMASDFANGSHGYDASIARIETKIDALRDDLMNGDTGRIPDLQRRMAFVERIAWLAIAFAFLLQPMWQLVLRVLGGKP